MFGYGSAKLKYEPGLQPTRSLFILFRDLLSQISRVSLVVPRQSLTFVVSLKAIVLFLKNFSRTSAFISGCNNTAFLV
jgi:hypothetical protein